MAGVYDITKHFFYEASYGVEELSTMKRAVGGPTKFAQQSPAVILAQALRRAAGADGKQHDASGMQNSKASFYE